MSVRKRIWIIGAVIAALALAGCGVAAIPDDEVAGMVGGSTTGNGGDTAALSIFGVGTPTSSKSFDVEQTFTFGDIFSLTYNYTIDYLKAGESVDPAEVEDWDEVTVEGSSELVVNLPSYDADRSLDVDFDVTGFHDEEDDWVTLNGTSVASGTATWTNPTTEVTAGYTMDLSRAWTNVVIDDPTDYEWSGYPASGTVVITGSVERHRETPSGTRTGRWSGTITITYNGTWIVPVDVNGSSNQLNLLTGEVTAGT